MRTIVLEKLPTDALIRVLIALEGKTVLEFAKSLGVSYRQVLNVSNGYSPCGHKLLMLLVKKYDLNFDEMYITVSEYNSKFKKQFKTRTRR